MTCGIGAWLSGWCGMMLGVRQASPNETRRASQWSVLLVLMSKPNLLFIGAAGLYLCAALAFLLLTFSGVSDARISVGFAVCSTTLPWIASQTFKKEAHDKAVFDLKDQHRKEIAAQRRQQRDASKTVANHSDELKVSESAAVAKHAAMSVRKVFRASTAFGDIQGLSDRAIAALTHADDGSPVPRLVGETLGRIQIIAKREVEASPDMIESWRVISPEEVEKAMDELRQQQEGMN